MLGRAFAEKVKASPATISQIMRGHKKPSIDLAARIEKETKGRVRASDWVKEVAE